MSTTRATLIAAAKVLAQESSATPLLTQASDYDQVLKVALLMFASDVPNLRVVHHTVTTAAFRFVLYGTGAIVSGLDAWTPGRSQMRVAWYPYSTAAQGQSPLDPNSWRVVEEPSLTVLELLDLTPSSSVLRLEYASPHTVHASDVAQTSVRAGDVDALATLLAVKILDAYATRIVQNTGSMGLQVDVVNGQSQSDVARARARDLYRTYRAMVGTSDPDDVRPASATVDLDIDTSHAMGMLWHARGRR